MRMARSMRKSEVLYFRKDRTFEVIQYFIMWYFCKNNNNTVMIVP